MSSPPEVLMCSEYTVKTNPAKIAGSLGLKTESFQSDLEDKTWDQRIRLTNQAPIVVQEKDQVSLIESVFPQMPFPNSRLSGIEDSDPEHPQIKRIYERPTWKKGFEKHPCLIPISSFLEPVYWGSEMGSVMEFTPTKEDLLFVAGIRLTPRLPKTTELGGFSMLTHTPTEQMLKYHHRLLVFLRPKDALEWIADTESPAREKFKFLLNKRYLPTLEVTEQRKMASGWKSRTAKHVQSLEQEKQYMGILGTEKVTG